MTFLMNLRLGAFYYVKGKDIAICRKFATAILGIPVYEAPSDVRGFFSRNNPKRKGWKRISYSDRNYVKFGSLEFVLCVEERTFLEQMNINIGDSFWIKIEQI